MRTPGWRSGLRLGVELSGTSRRHTKNIVLGKTGVRKRRQADSFVGRVEAPKLGGELPAVFIRAPRIRAVGPGVEVLATLKGEPVLVRCGNVAAATFHPELTDDNRVHEAALEHAFAAGTKA